MKIKLHEKSNHAAYVREYELDTNEQYYMTVDSGEVVIDTFENIEELFNKFEFHRECYKNDDSRDEKIAGQMGLQISFKHNGDINEYLSEPDDIETFNKLSETERFEEYRRHVNSVCLEEISLEDVLRIFYNPSPFSAHFSTWETSLVKIDDFDGKKEYSFALELLRANA